MVKGQQIDLEGSSLIPNEREVGQLFTVKGRADILQHERKRVRVYKLGYSNYLAPSQGSAQHTTRCNNVCSKTPGAAKTALLKYLSDLREKAVKEFWEYSLREQFGIGLLENDSDNSFWSLKITISSNPDTPAQITRLFDGYIRKYRVRLPPRFTPPPCPKNIDDQSN